MKFPSLPPETKRALHPHEHLGGNKAPGQAEKATHKPGTSPGAGGAIASLNLMAEVMFSGRALERGGRRGARSGCSPGCALAFCCGEWLLVILTPSGRVAPPLAS